MNAHIIDARGVYLRTEQVDPMGPQPAGAVYGVVPAAQEGHTRLWRGEWAQVPDADVPPVPAPPPPAVPPAVTMRQARRALLAAGLLDDVTAAIEALSSPTKEAAQIDWEYGNTVERHNGLVASLGPALGLTEEQIDDLFVAGAAL